MANKEIFSKHIKSNVKLATRYDAEGREVQVSQLWDSRVMDMEWIVDKLSGLFQFF